MTDLQARISGVVLNRLADYGIDIDREVADSVAEAVMAMPGTVTVELPEPDDDHHDGIAFWWQATEVGASDGMVVTQFDPGSESIWLHPELARNIAGALLAAAVQAQEEQ